MRYSRQELFIGKKGQQQLQNSKVAIMGLGALGTVSAELLARAGIGHLTLIDRDIVELTNLQRQGLFLEEDLGKPKSLQAQKRLEKINSEITIEPHFIHLDYENIDLIKANIILDCSDNLETRFLLNEFSIRENTPLIYSAAVRDKGYIFSVLPGKACLNCILNQKKTIETCETSGVLNTTTHLIASLQVSEAIKILTHNYPKHDLLFVDLSKNVIKKIKVKKNPRCQSCLKQFQYLPGKKTLNSLYYCGTYVIKDTFDYQELKNRLKKLNIQDFGDAFHYQSLTVFPNCILIRATTKKEARTIYSKYIGN